MSFCGCVISTGWNKYSLVHHFFLIWLNLLGCEKGRTNIQSQSIQCTQEFHNQYSFSFNPSSPKGGCNNPQQFSPWCSKSRSQGVKLLRVPASSSFPFISVKKFKPTTYHGGRVRFQSWEVGGGVVRSRDF